MNCAECGALLLNWEIEEYVDICSDCFAESEPEDQSITTGGNNEKD